MPIKLADYKKAVMTIRQYLGNVRSAQSHPPHGKDDIPDHYGRSVETMWDGGYFFRVT
jgi:hypothetical protein